MTKSIDTYGDGFKNISNVVEEVIKASKMKFDHVARKFVKTQEESDETNADLRVRIGKNSAAIRTYVNEL